MKSPTEKKKIRFFLFFILIPHIKFQDPISKCFRPYAKCDPWTHACTHGQAQTNMLPQLLRSWGHKKESYYRLKFRDVKLETSRSMWLCHHWLSMDIDLFPIMPNKITILIQLPHITIICIINKDLICQK